MVGRISKRLASLKPRDKFSRWTVIGAEIEYDAFGEPKILCRCMCGNEKNIFCHNLFSGMSKSCGCFHPKKTHGCSYLVEYSKWKYMSKNSSKLYPEWVNDVNAFVDWLQETFGSLSKGDILERIDKRGNFEPGNLRVIRRDNAA